VCHGDWRVPVRRLRAGAPAAARPGQPVAADMADHAHGPVAKKVMVAVGGQGIDAEVVRLACSMTDAHGKLYGVHIIEVNRSLPLGAEMDEVVERGEKILDEVEQLATEAQLHVEAELVPARDTRPAVPDEANRRRPHYFARLLAELNTTGGKHDAFIKVIIIERIGKALVLITLGVGLLVAGREGWLTQWAASAQQQLNLDTDETIFEQLFFRLLVMIGNFPHMTLLAIGAFAYAVLEGTEGIGLAMRRRWAEYLTVIATGVLIPFEAYEVVHKVTL